MDKELSTKQKIIADLNEAGLSPIHKFGQNFMIDQSTIAEMPKALGEDLKDRKVLEIGPGTGVLTEKLLEAGAIVLAIEIDKGMASLASDKFEDNKNFSLVHSDALKSKTELIDEIISFTKDDEWFLCSNLPYDISIPLILNTMQLENPPNGISVTVQLEAATRLCAKSGTKQWGATSLIAQSFGEGKIVRKVPPTCFYPKPRVDSAILKWTVNNKQEKGYALWCRQLFSFRKKIITRALRNLSLEKEIAEKACVSTGIALDTRVEKLTVEQATKLYGALQKLI